MSEIIDRTPDDPSNERAWAELQSLSGKKLPASIDFSGFTELDVALDPGQRTMWGLMRPKGPPSFTRGLLRDIAAAMRLIHRIHLEREPGSPNPVTFCVMASDTPGIFNLGGDLGFFVKCVRAGDREGLRAYAYDCVEATFCGLHGMEAPCLSILVVEGDALGGGFEAAISGHILIAERGARMGMPEALFNTFPGMGAYSFLSRKLGMVRAEKLIMSGKIHTAEEMFDLGVVDLLAEPGEARDAARKYIADNQRRQPLLHAMNKVRKRVFPITREELRDVVDIWVDTTMELGPGDLRKMEYLMEAQTRRRGGTPFNIGGG